MSQTISIDPVTRIEGHATVFLNLAENGSLESAGLVVNELRGFERILVGMEADRMPLITSRICGVCPSAHHLAAVKALDAAAGVEPPPAGKLLRELLYMGHFIHSHALSLFVLQGPDLVLGLDADPAVRNIVGLVKAVPEVAKKAIRLRSLGQKINELVGGRGTHPVTAVAGGISFRLDAEKQRILGEWIDECVVLGVELGATARDLLLKRVEADPELLEQWVLPTWYMGTVKDNKVNLYDGQLRVIDDTGKIQLEFPAAEYRDHLVESALNWSYMKPTFIRHQGEKHAYRVNPLGRLNVAAGMETPLADQEFRAFHQNFGNPCHATIMHIYARIIELIYACEKAKELITDPRITGETRVPVQFRPGRAVGHVEAPRGCLFHDYEIDEKGIVRSANLVVATQQNYESINQSIAQAAQTHVIGKQDEQLLNAVEFAIRCYDPCLSCATHAVGRMPLDLVFRRQGEVVRQVRRDG
ncbi:MAG: Ni/Fe hydrogenase subunit alpha [Candidatus Latescibacteria bacterium]|nr:Ni/Fe hydrogenase subunit alpha [Candidatus Latescibacterota bacterium]